MKIIKSMRTGLLHRTFLYQRRHFFTASMLWGFRLDSSDNVLEPHVWETIGKRLEAGQPFDQAMPKGQGEFLVHGSFHAPGGQAVTGASVSVRMGERHKAVTVWGDRVWKGLGMSRPEPFTEMPATYRQAFGGEGFARNTRGKGALPEVKDPGEHRPLPNLEYPQHPITSPDDRPPPAAYDPLDIMWAQRAQYSGTYDERYLRDAFLGLPDDIDWRFFNDAASDQWFKGFLEGNEAFEIIHMHPDHGLIQGHLPGIRGRCFVEQAITGSTAPTQIQEIPLRTDTVWLFPGDMIGVAILRGSMEVKEDDGSDILTLLLGAETLDQPPRPPAHYIAELKKRADPDQGYRYLMQTGPLLPLGCPTEFETLLAQDGTPENSAVGDNLEHYLANQQAKLERDIEQNLTQMEAGLDARGLLQPTPSPSPEQEKIDQLLEAILPGLSKGGQGISADQLLASITSDSFKPLEDYLNTLQAEQLAKARTQLEDNRQRLVQALASEADSQARQPLLEQLDQLDRLLQGNDSEDAPSQPLPRVAKTLEAQVTAQDALFKAQREQLEALITPDGTEVQDAIAQLDQARDLTHQQVAGAVTELREQHRLSAHYLPAASSPHPAEEGRIAAALLAAFKAGRPTADGDYAFIDLSGQCLKGIDLRGACLEYADLSDCDLTGADLTGAVLTHARLVGTRFEHAGLHQANLGHCRIENALFLHCDMTEAVLSYAKVSASRFVHCDLRHGRFAFHQTRCFKTHFESVRLDDHIFLESVFEHCHWYQCCLDRAVMMQVRLTGSAFSDCDLATLSLLMGQADGVSLLACRMPNARLMGGCSLKQAVFKQTRLDDSSFREACLEGADFTGAELNRCDFSQVNATGACFDRVVARTSLWYKAELGGASLCSADLMEASLHKARSQGANFTGASLFGANLLQITLADTRFNDCILTRTLLQDWRPLMT